MFEIPFLQSRANWQNLLLAKLACFAFSKLNVDISSKILIVELTCHVLLIINRESKNEGFLINRPACHIATMGPKSDWVIQGRNIRPFHVLVIICGDDEPHLTVAKELKRYVEGPSEAEIPIEARPQVTIIPISRSQDLTVITLLMQDQIKKYGRTHDIIINATSGPTTWQLGLYLAAISLRELVAEFIIFEKDTGNPVQIWLPRQDLSVPAQKILRLLNTAKDPPTLSFLANSYEEGVSKGLISRYLTTLVNEGLVRRQKAGTGRKKTFFLTDLGKIQANALLMEGGGENAKDRRIRTKASGLRRSNGDSLAGAPNSF